MKIKTISHLGGLTNKYHQLLEYKCDCCGHYGASYLVEYYSEFTESGYGSTKRCVNERCLTQAQVDYFLNKL
jgi:hypothetical protein